jgi:hypothetical protein
MARGLNYVCDPSLAARARLGPSLEISILIKLWRNVPWVMFSWLCAYYSERSYCLAEMEKA